MATAEQLAGVLQAQTAVMQQAMEASMTRLLEGLMGRLAQGTPVGGGAGGGAGHGGGQRFKDVGKIFKDVGTFSGDEGAWAEWALKFRATVKEYDFTLFRVLEMAGDAEGEVVMTEVETSNITEHAVEKSAMIYNRMVHLLSGPALTLHQSVPEERAWRCGGC